MTVSPAPHSILLDNVSQEPGSNTAGTTATAEADQAAHTTFRQLLEALACLAIAVIVFRAFVLEGYIISTGSMAPSLLGYHKRVRCPECGFPFAFGVSIDHPDRAAGQIATCPNCQLPAIDVSNVPRNDGDQLLVLKNAWLAELGRWLDMTGPRRWDVVVFHNPNDPSQAYVKRAIGLPGESLLIQDGDIFVNGERQRKSLGTQRAIRIPVFDHDFPSLSPDWMPRWVDDSGRWQPSGRAFVVSHENASQPGEHAADPAEIAWLKYHHWARTDRHRPAAPAASGAIEPGSMATGRAQPVVDQYGYNRWQTDPDRARAHDLMLTAELTWESGRGGIAATLRNRRDRVICLLDPAGRSVSVFQLPNSVGSPGPALASLLTARLQGDTQVPGLIAVAQLWAEWPLDLEFSVFDRQVIVAVDGEILVQQPLSEDFASAAPTAFPLQTDGHTSLREPDTEVKPYSQASIGVLNGTARVSSIRLFRDVHYTAEAGQHATSQALQLGEDEFFMLGDNSPVSLDSRGWPDPVVPRRLLIGRPLVVHLPSRPGRLRIGNRVSHIRVPDFSRMRCIR